MMSQEKFILILCIGMLSSFTKNREEQPTRVLVIELLYQRADSLVQPFYYFQVNDSLYNGDFLEQSNYTCYRNIADSSFVPKDDQIATHVALRDELLYLLEKNELQQLECEDEELNKRFKYRIIDVYMSYQRLPCVGRPNPLDFLMQKPSGFIPVNVFSNYAKTSANGSLRFVEKLEAKSDSIVEFVESPKMHHYGAHW